MSKVIGNSNSVRCAENFKSSVNTAELVKILGNFLRSSAKIMCSSRSGKCIINVVLSGNDKLNLCELLPLEVKVKLLVNTLVCADVFSSVISVFAITVGDFLNLNILYGIKSVFVITVDNKQACCLMSKFVE